MLITQSMYLGKILVDCGFMRFHVNSPGVFFNAGVFFKLCIFIASSKTCGRFYLSLISRQTIFFSEYTFPGFAHSEIDKYFQC